MSDKDQFTFEDDDDFPETDLSSAFSDSEREADSPAQEFDETFFTDEEEPEPDPDPDPDPDLEPAVAAAAAVPQKGKKAKKEKKPKKEKTAGSGGNSRTRGLLLILLLVIAGAAGAYYFMDLGGTTPAVPTAPAPAQKAVALPPKPASAPAPVTQPEPAKTVQVAVPPPPPPVKVAGEKTAKSAEPATPEKQQAKVEPPKPAPAPQPVAKQTEPVKQAEAAKAAEQAKAATTVAVPAPPAKPAPAAVAKTAEQSAPAMAKVEPATALPTVVPKQVDDGAFALDAGSYLFESNRDALIAKIKALGYDPKVTPVDATLDMTRLRLGTFSKADVQEALDMARSIEPGSYSAPAGDQYVIYAGTFLGKGNIDKLTKRFNAEGIKVYPEPVQVVRTLSRIRFGSFATKEDASLAVAAVADDGIKAVVVKSK